MISIDDSSDTDYDRETYNITVDEVPKSAVMASIALRVERITGIGGYANIEVVGAEVLHTRSDGDRDPYFYHSANLVFFPAENKDVRVDLYGNAARGDVFIKSYHDDTGL